MDPTMILLRLVHVLAGVFWTGSAVLLAFFLFPSVRAAGLAGGQVMGQLMTVRRLPVHLTTAGLLTLFSGLGMMWRLGALTNGAWLRASSSHTFMLGATLALVGGIVGSTVSRRTALRIAALGARSQAAGAPPTPAQAAEMAALQARLGQALHTVAGLLLLAAAAMAVGRYT